MLYQLSYIPIKKAKSVFWSIEGRVLQVDFENSQRSLAYGPGDGLPRCNELAPFSIKSAAERPPNNAPRLSIGDRRSR
jgi:hypothetical protein